VKQRTRVLATGDHHFDGARGHLPEAVRVHERMVQLANEYDVNLFVSGGDLYERESSVAEREAACTFVLEMMANRPGILAKGNHDAERDLAILARLKTAHPFIVEERFGVHHLAGVAVAAMAWPDRTAIVSALPEGQRTLAAAGDLAHQAIRNVLAGMGQEMAIHAGPRLGLGHFMCDGSIAANGQPLLGQPIRVGLEDFLPLGAQAVVCSHIHLRQEWTIGDCRVMYPGSAYADTSDQVDRKTVTLLEWHGSELVEVVHLDSGATRQFYLTAEWDPATKGFSGSLGGEDITGAIVRIKYQVPAEHLSFAAESADRLQRELLGAGAVAVEFFPSAMVEKRARVPELAKQSTIKDKLVTWWEANAFDPGERRAPLLEKVAALETEVGRTGRNPVGVELLEFECRGLDTYTEGWGFDLSEYPDDAPLIALRGVNGKGKTLALECSLSGAMYQTMPTQGTLGRRAITKDAFVRSVISTGGETWDIRHDIDAVTGDCVSVVVGSSGATPLKGTKGGPKAFKAWAAKALPDPDVFFATQFACQHHPKGRKSFIDSSSADRMSLILEASGVERIEDMAKAARRELDSTQVRLRVLLARIEDEERSVGDLDALRNRLAEATARAATAKWEADVASSQLSEGKVAAERARVLQEAEAAQKQRVTELTDKVAKLTERADVLRGLVAKATEVSLAVSRVTELESALETERLSAEAATKRSEIQAELDSLTAQIASLAARAAELDALVVREAEVLAAEQEAAALTSKMEAAVPNGQALADAQRAAEGALATANQEAAQLGAELSQLSKTVQNRAEVAAAVERLPSLTAQLEESVASKIRVQDEARRLRDLVVSGISQRAGDLREAVETIAGEPMSPAATARDALGHDDATIAQIAEAPALAEIAESRLNGAIAELLLLGEECQKAKALADSHPAILAADTRLSELDRQILVVKDRQAACLSTLEVAKAEAGAARAAYVAWSEAKKALAPVVALGPQIRGARQEQAEAAAKLAALQGRMATTTEELARVPAPPAGPAVDHVELDRLRLVASQVDSVRDAVALLPEVEKQLSEAGGELATLRSAAPAVSLEVPDLPSLASAAETAAANLREAEQAATRGQAELEQAERHAERLRELVGEKDLLRLEEHDWTVLAADLGRKGLQSAEVDSAGPELTALVNDLLHTCHGPRFSVSIETKRLSADGKDEVDECRVEVIDSELGRRREVLEYSGGQRAFLGEAVAGALMIFACLKAGVRRPTLVRDEAGAHLDPVNHRAYIAMLRAIVERVGASRMLLVVHDPTVIPLCDAVIDVGVTVPKADENKAVAA
jgi:exonuclease SbcC